MHKCIDCGTEFEGKFCPKCGKPRQREAICPKCGSPVQSGARFCSECGYAFVATDTGYSQRSVSSAVSLEKLYGLLRLLPALLFVLFSVLAFAFFAAPLVSEADFGEAFSVETIAPLGGMSDDFSFSVNVYTGLADEDFSSQAISLFVFGMLGLCLAVVTALFTFVYPIKGARVTLKGKIKLPVSAALAYVCYAFYFSVFLAGCIVTGKINAEGEGLLTAGACPVLFIVFSIVFGLLSAAGVIARYLIGKQHPEWRACEREREEQEYLEFRDAKKLKEERERVRAEWIAAYKKEHPEPQPVGFNLSKPQKKDLELRVELTPALEQEVDRALRKKRLATWLCFFVPLFVISWIGAIVAGIKRVGYCPKKLLKHKLLSFGSVFTFIIMLYMLLTLGLVVGLGMSMSEAQMNDIIIPLAAILPCVIYLLVVFIIARSTIGKLNKLNLKMYGAKNPIKENKEQYKSECEKYRRTLKKYKRNPAFMQYREQLARYETEMLLQLNKVLKSVKISHET